MIYVASWPVSHSTNVAYSLRPLHILFRYSPLVEHNSSIATPGRQTITEVSRIPDKE